jgi:hypothetical protein
MRAFAPRRSPRCPIAVPVRVTVLRSGASYSIPGRSLNLGEGGISVVLAGEVKPTDMVGVEFLLPDLGLGLQAKAVVRHQSPTRCGFEFQGLTKHQQAVIREWSRQMLQVKTPASFPPHREGTFGATLARPARVRRILARLQRLILPTVAVLGLIALIMWWHWQRGWKELEEQVPRRGGQAVWIAAANLSYCLGENLQ